MAVDAIFQRVMRPYGFLGSHTSEPSGAMLGETFRILLSSPSTSVTTWTALVRAAPQVSGSLRARAVDGPICSSLDELGMSANLTIWLLLGSTVSMSAAACGNAAIFWD